MAQNIQDFDGTASMQIVLTGNSVCHQAITWVILVGTLKVCNTFWCISARTVGISSFDIFLLLESYSMAAVLILGREAFTKLSMVEDSESDIPIILEVSHKKRTRRLCVDRVSGADRL